MFSAQDNVIYIELSVAFLFGPCKTWLGVHFNKNFDLSMLVSYRFFVNYYIQVCFDRGEILH